MARGVNKAIIIGRLGRDPDIRYSGQGNAVAKFSLAVNEWRKDKDDHVEWIDCVCFGKSAEFVGEYAKKGAQVYVEGSIRTSTYEKDGQKRYRTEVVARDVQLLSAVSNQVPAEEDFTEDVPF